jgi:hypothetical protein
MTRGQEARAMNSWIEEIMAGSPELLALYERGLRYCQSRLSWAQGADTDDAAEDIVGNALLATLGEHPDCVHDMAMFARHIAEHHLKDFYTLLKGGVAEELKNRRQILSWNDENEHQIEISAFELPGAELNTTAISASDSEENAEIEEINPGRREFIKAYDEARGRLQAFLDAIPADSWHREALRRKLVLKQDQKQIAAALSKKYNRPFSHGQIRVALHRLERALEAHLGDIGDKLRTKFPPKTLNRPSAGDTDAGESGEALA